VWLISLSVESTSPMLRNMVIGKVKYLIGPASETTATLFVEVGFIFLSRRRMQSGQTL